MQICHSFDTHLVKTADQQKLLQTENVFSVFQVWQRIQRLIQKLQSLGSARLHTEWRQTRGMSNSGIFLASLPPHKQFSFSFFSPFLASFSLSKFEAGLKVTMYWGGPWILILLLLSRERWDYRCVHHPVDAVQARQAYSWATLPPKSPVSLVFIWTVLDCFQTLLENQLGST